MVLLQADVTCDGWFYETPAGEKINRCGRSFIAHVSFDSVRTSLRKRVQEKGWWRDPNSSSAYPRHVCPECRKIMCGK
jgi:hypothetical protein